jgi:hypothetical protein
MVGLFGLILTVGSASAHASRRRSCTAHRRGADAVAGPGEGVGLPSRQPRRLLFRGCARRLSFICSYNSRRQPPPVTDVMSLLTSPPADHGCGRIQSHASSVPGGPQIVDSAFGAEPVADVSALVTAVPERQPHSGRRWSTGTKFAAEVPTSARATGFVGRHGCVRFNLAAERAPRSR